MTNPTPEECVCGSEKIKMPHLGNLLCPECDKEIIDEIERDLQDEEEWTKEGLDRGWL